MTRHAPCVFESLTRRLSDCQPAAGSSLGAETKQLMTSHEARDRRTLGTRLLGREIAEAPKAGFQAPFSAWFSGPLRGYVRDKINSLGEALPGLLDSQVLDRVEREHADGVRDHGLKLWGIVALSEWSQTYPGIRTEDPQEERPPS